MPQTKQNVSKLIPTVPRRIKEVTTDETGQISQSVRLQPKTKYVICKDEHIPPAKPMESRQAIVQWIDACVLGDLRTLILGISEKNRSDQRQAGSQRPLGGCNFLLAAGCCMVLEYFGQLYGKGANATASVERYIEDFLRNIEPRYMEVFPVLWTSFRNGIVHGSWPQAVCIQDHLEERVAVGANSSPTGDHLEPASDYSGKSFVISSHRFFVDIERSFDEGFRHWLLHEADEAVLERAAPRLLEIKKGNTRGRKAFNLIKSWNA